MKSKLLLAVFLICSGITPASVFAKTYYLARNGDDNASGTISQPWATLRFVNKRLTPGDTLYLRKGVYTEYIHGNDWTASGSRGKRIIISGYPGEKVIFDGKNSKSTWLSSFLRDIKSSSFITLANLEFRNYNDTLINIANCGSWILENLYIHDIGISGGNSYGAFILGKGCDSCVVRNCRMVNIGTKREHHFIYVAGGAKNLDVCGNYFENAAGACIHGWHGPNGQHIRIYNNVFCNSHVGVLFSDGAKDIKIYNNTFYNNDYGLCFMHKGADVKWGVRNVEIVNNCIVATSKKMINMIVAPWNVKDIKTDYNLWFHPAKRPIVWNGQWWDKHAFCSVRKYSRISGNAKHALSNDPLFRNPGAKQFSLQAKSPCINSGATKSSVKMDINGNPRPSGAKYDIGAYEYQSEAKE